MQPASSTTQPSSYGTTTTSTTSTSSTNADRPPTVRTAETNQRKATVRRDKDSSEEVRKKKRAPTKNASASQTSGKPTRRRTKKGRQSTRHSADCHALVKKARVLPQPGYRLVHQALVLQRQPAMHPGLGPTRLTRIGCSWNSGSRLRLIFRWKTVKR